MEEENNEIEIRSEEVHEILSHVPNWMIRWGITLIFILVIMLLVLSWVIKYPDVVQGKLTLTTEHPPSRLVCQANGYIASLLVENDILVAEGEVIAEIKSPVSKQSIDELNKILNGVDQRVIITQLQNLKGLGILQSDVNLLINSLIEYQDLLANPYYTSSIKNLSDQIKQNKQLASITKQEIDLFESEIANAREKFEADSKLFEEQVIAKYTYYQNQTEYLAKEQQMINTRKLYVQQQITSSNYEKQRIDLEKNYQDQKRQLETAIDNTKNAIATAITNWRQSFVLTAPSSGRLTYLSNLSEQQYVQTGQNLFAIIPKDEAVIGIIQITDQAFGKVKLHQKVRMKFDNYPFQEFGQLVGKIDDVSRIPSKDGYYVRVVLENGLTTTYEKEIEYKPEMTGIAEVVTDDLRLIQRIFSNVRKLLDK